MKCFVIMPFRQSFDAVFGAVRDAACSSITESDFECYWLKDVHAAGRITDDIVAGLSDAAFCIADLSENNPNVMWETGFAMALGKPTILIGQDVESLPFDLRSHRVLPYSSGDLADLRVRLGEAVRDTLARHELSPAMRRVIVKRLLKLSHDVQSILVTLQSESFRSLLDRPEFEKIRATSVGQVKRLAKEYMEDADKLGVIKQADSVVQTVAKAVESLPFPEEMIVTQDDMISGLFRILTEGGSAGEQVHDRFTKL